MGIYYKKALTLKEQIQLFNACEGYWDINNDVISDLLVKMQLSEETNRKDFERVAHYVRLTYSASFLYMMNAWQWLFSSVYLSRTAFMPAQENQAEYYSIFFAKLSFLASQNRGVFTIVKEYGQDVLNTKKVRKAMWMNYDERVLEIDNPVKSGGQHETIARWFYDVFKEYDRFENYSDVGAFAWGTDQKWHTHFRNKYTYSLDSLCEELFCAFEPTAVSNDTLMRLWEDDYDLIQVFPELYWALGHLRLVTETHLELINNCSASASLKFSQLMLINGFRSHHAESELTDFFDRVFTDNLTNAAEIKAANKSRNVNGS